MKIRQTVIWILLALSGPLPAHHSVGVFDTSTPIWVKGTVERVEFMHPHPVIYLQELSEDGHVTRWAIESSGTVNLQIRRGFTRDTLKQGDVIEACGYAPKVAYTYPDKAKDSDDSVPWLDHPDRIITGRLLILPGGPEVDWSHYGPLDKCISVEELDLPRS